MPIPPTNMHLSSLASWPFIQPPDSLKLTRFVRPAMSSSLSIQHATATTTAQAPAHATNRAPGSKSQSEMAASIALASKHASTMRAAASAVSRHDVGLRRISKAQRICNSIGKVSDISCFREHHSGCCERGVVLHAPSCRWGMYVTRLGARDIVMGRSTGVDVYGTRGMERIRDKALGVIKENGWPGAPQLLQMGQAFLNAQLYLSTWLDIIIICYGALSNSIPGLTAPTFLESDNSRYQACRSLRVYVSNQ